MLKISQMSLANKGLACFSLFFVDGSPVQFLEPRDATGNLVPVILSHSLQIRAPKDVASLRGQHGGKKPKFTVKRMHGATRVSRWIPNRASAGLVDRIADKEELFKLGKFFELFKLCPLGNQVIADATGLKVSSCGGGEARGGETCQTKNTYATTPHVEDSEIRELLNPVQLVDEVVRAPQLLEGARHIIEAFNLLDAIAAYREHL
jgi:hypothetical protein